MELTQLANGTIYVRYLPKGVTIGSDTPQLTVATYPFPGAYEALQAVAKQKGSTPINVSQGGIAVVRTPSRRTSTWRIPASTTRSRFSIRQQAIPRQSSPAAG